MNFDIRIMAHPKRKNIIEEFCKKYNIAQDCISYDDSGSALNGARRAYLAPIDDNVTHRLILQDDVLIVNNFFDIVQKNIEMFPHAVFSYYEGRDVTFADKIKPSPYIKMQGCCICGLAVVMPKDFIHPCFSWIDDNFPADYKHDDCAIGLYCLLHGISVFSTIPSLVQHKLPMNSTMRGHNHAGKISTTWLGEVVEDTDWNDTDYNFSRKFRNDTWLKPEDPYNIELMKQIRRIYK